MTKAPGTIDFMPPEALAASENVKYERELDVFSFGCVMLHTLSHQWPTPSEPVVTDPLTFEMKAKSEVERRSSYFDKISEGKPSALIPLIKGCLNNIPKKRISIVEVCGKLERLADKQRLSIDDIDLPSSALQQEIERKDAEIRNKDMQIQHQANEIEALKSGMAKLQMQFTTHDPVLPKVDLLSRQVQTTKLL